MLQNWTEHGRPSDSTSLGQRVLEWTCAGLSLFLSVSQLVFLLKLLCS
jgi:hypothetical protein